MNTSPSDLCARKLCIDLKQGFPRHWHRGDAFRSMYFNALSMSFPVGEQAFIDAVRAGLELLPDNPEHNSLRVTVQQFIAQEATHRHIHGLYNVHLEKQGLDNRWQHWATKRVDAARANNMHPLTMIALTAAYEHCTAVFADCTLRYDNWLDHAEPKMQMLWRWHAAEETEHKAVAFDLYQTLGGGYTRRALCFAYAFLLFVVESNAQTLLNLWHDRSLFKLRTWWSLSTLAFGKNGMFWRCTLPLLRYFKRGFHPNDDNNRELAEQWLTKNAYIWEAVRRPATQDNRGAINAVVRAVAP